MEAYFDKTKRIMPQQNDLSFYNWETHLSTSNPTPNFQVWLKTYSIAVPNYAATAAGTSREQLP